MSNHLTPSAVIEHIIGRPEIIGAAIGADPKSPYVWRKGSKNRDAGDIPSARHMRALLAYAAARGIPLTADDLIWGVDAAEIEARMARHEATAGDRHSPPGAAPTGGGVDAPVPFIRSRAGHSPVTGAHLQADAPRTAGPGSPAVKSFVQVCANG